MRCRKQTPCRLRHRNVAHRLRQRLRPEPAAVTSADTAAVRSKPKGTAQRPPLGRDRNAAIGPTNARRRVLANGVQHAVLNAGLAASRLEGASPT